MQVNYDEKTSKGRDDASDYSAQSEDSGEESGEEDMPALKVCNDCFWVQSIVTPSLICLSTCTMQAIHCLWTQSEVLSPDTEVHHCSQLVLALMQT